MAADTPDVAGETPHPAFEAYAAEAVPQAAVGSPSKDGVLDLTFAATKRGTTLVHDYATAPFHVSGTLAHDPHPDAATVFVQSSAGGIAQGDRHDVDVTLEEGTVVHVSTAGATKVQSMRRNYAAADVTLSVGRNAHLDYVPEPTILHADARYAHELGVSLAPGATAVVGDCVVPGRLAHDERFAFERYVSRVRVEGPGGLLFEDTTELAPGETDPSRPGVLGEFAVLGTLFVLAPGHGDAGALSDRLHEAVAACEARAAATTLPGGAGVLVRALGHHSEPVGETLHTAWDHARRALVDAPAPSGRRY